MVVKIKLTEEEIKPLRRTAEIKQQILTLLTEVGERERIAWDSLRTIYGKDKISFESARINHETMELILPYEEVTE